MKTRFILPLFFCMTLISCVSSQFVSLENSNKENPNVEVYLKELNKPTKEYEVLSYIEVSGSVFTTNEKLIKAMKKKANKIGGDALISVDFFYIPWALSSLPAAKGVIVKYK